MGLQLYNPRKQSDDMTYLAVTMRQDIINSTHAIGKSIAYASAAFAICNTIAAPIAVVVAGTASTAYTTLLSTYEKATRNTLETGQLKMIKAKRPHI